MAHNKFQVNSYSNEGFQVDILELLLVYMYLIRKIISPVQ